MNDSSKPVETAAQEIVFAVLLYPPKGAPRVVELPAMPIASNLPLSVFGTRDAADAALERFLVANPEYRNWRDGRIDPALSLADKGATNG